MKTRKFYIIEKFYDRGTIEFRRGSAMADRIENVVIPEAFFSREEDEDGKPVPVSEYSGFTNDASDFTKVSKDEGYLDLEQFAVGIGSTRDKARAALAKAEAWMEEDEDEHWD